MSFWALGPAVLLFCLLRNDLESILRLAEEGFINRVPLSFWAHIQVFEPLFTSVPGNLRAGPTG